MNVARVGGMASATYGVRVSGMTSTRLQTLRGTLGKIDVRECVSTLNSKHLPPLTLRKVPGLENTVTVVTPELPVLAGLDLVTIFLVRTIRTVGVSITSFKIWNAFTSIT